MAKRIWPLVVLLTVVSAGPLAAQATSIEFVPYGGALLTMGDLAGATLVDTVTSEETALTLRQKTGLVLGGRLVAWWSRTVGWEFGFAYALSTMEAKVEDGRDRCGEAGGQCNANVWDTSSKILLRYAPRPYRGWQVFGGAGLAVTGHVGEFWEEGEALTDLGGVFNVGASLDLSRVLAIRIDVEDYLYKFEPTLKDDPLVGSVETSKLQNDLVISAGLVIRLSGV
ncbi:MAG: hypothetical protein AMS21_05740 [Gemmatimonas sp. SG8_38_2]|nr:MAG: hypothetical protein AMS21_05740 [Gemmatimonas sp. SG8_38_2]